MSNTSKNIVWKPISQTQKILQLYEKGIEYALVSDKNEQCHSFVWCKDFLHDVVYSSVNNRSIDIYRFKYDPNKDPRPCLKKLKILVTNSKDKKIENKILKCLDFINQIEFFLKIKPTKALCCSNPPEGYNKVFLFNANKRWVNAPPMLSLYTLLIRLGFSHEINDNFLTTLEKIKLGINKTNQRYDKKWLLEIQEALNQIFKFGDKKIFSKDIKKNYPSNAVIDTVHNKMGIIGYSNDVKNKLKNLPVTVPLWHKD